MFQTTPAASDSLQYQVPALNIHKCFRYLHLHWLFHPRKDHLPRHIAIPRMKRQTQKSKLMIALGNQNLHVLCGYIYKSAYEMTKKLKMKEDGIDTAMQY